jgi:hypothetical protein
MTAMKVHPLAGKPAPPVSMWHRQIQRAAPLPWSPNSAAGCGSWTMTTSYSSSSCSALARLDARYRSRSRGDRATRAPCRPLWSRFVTSKNFDRSFARGAYFAVYFRGSFSNVALHAGLQK